MLTISKVLYAPITVVRNTNSTKVTVVRAKSKVFMAEARRLTTELVTSNTGFEPLLRNSDEGSMYQ